MTFCLSTMQWRSLMDFEKAASAFGRMLHLDYGWQTVCNSGVTSLESRRSEAPRFYACLPQLMSVQGLIK
jgi:hypothetical protein